MESEHEKNRRLFWKDQDAVTFSLECEQLRNQLKAIRESMKQ